MRATRRAWIAAASALFALGCGGGDTGGSGGGGAAPQVGCDGATAPSDTIACVHWFQPGPGAGRGQDDLPRIIQGGPTGVDARHQSLDVLSLGKGGEIAVGFGATVIVDGPGPDFVIFENPFLVGPNPPPSSVFAELGEVSVSEDGEHWTPFPCATEAYPFTGCAGWNPVLANADNGISPTDPAVAGGDAFDLADVGVSRARFLRIRDLSNYGGAPDAGFDLDAAVVIHAED